MGNIIGVFYFKMTKTGNLIGEYSNTEMRKIDAESANDISNEQGFIGTYLSTWEENNHAVLTTLYIEHKPQTDGKIYSLVWKGESNETIHLGEGMLVDDMLVGHYRDFGVKTDHEGLVV